MRISILFCMVRDGDKDHRFAVNEGLHDGSVARSANDKVARFDEIVLILDPIIYRYALRSTRFSSTLRITAREHYVVVFRKVVQRIKQ